MLISRNQVGDQPFGSGLILPGGDDDLADPGVRGQRGLDLTQLDPEPTDLDLLINAAQVLQLPTRAPAHQVPTAIHPLPGRAIRVGEETGSGQSGAVQVAPRQSGPRDVQLTGHPDRNRSQPVIQHKHSGIGDRGPDRWRVLDGGISLAVPRGGVHRSLGRAVNVRDSPAAGRHLDLPSHPGRERLPRQHHCPGLN